MRIGFDMLAVQAPDYGDERISGFSRQLIAALLARDDGHEYFLYAHDRLPAEGLATTVGAQVRWLGPAGLTVSQQIDRLVRVNPDGLDVLVVLSPFEHWSNYHPPSPPVQGAGPRLAAVVHDMSLLHAVWEHVYDPVLVRRYRVLEELKRYDAVLATSEATRADCLRMLGVEEARVTTISGEGEDPSQGVPRFLAVLQGLTTRRPPVPRPPRPRSDSRPRLAFFSPLPPRKSGVSDYSTLLLQELKEAYTIDVYHDSGYIPGLGLVEGEFACCDARLFESRRAVRDYHALVYQMGNSRYHQFLYRTMLRHPGVVTLHDFSLSGFHLDYGDRQGQDREFIRNELLRWYPGQAAEFARVLDTTPWDRELIAHACAERSWHLNRRVLQSAEWVVVHSPWCLEQVRRTAPEECERLVVIPHGIWPRSISQAERSAIRARFDIPDGALLFASFGFVHPDKLSVEALDAFVSVVRSNPKALFVFAGEESDGGVVRRHAEGLGLPDHIRFLGRQEISDFTDLIAASDVGINLRRPPTSGETSGALLHLLASGVATIVTDVGTFSDYPDDTVWKVRWESQGRAGLHQALQTLASDRPAREALGRAGQAYTRAYHEWPRVAKSYIDVIERCRTRRAG